MTTLDFPRDGVSWSDYLEIYVTSRLDAARATLDALREGRGTDVLSEWNEADIAILHAEQLPQILAESHPDADVRELAGTLYVRAKALRLDRDQDATLFARCRDWASGEDKSAPPPVSKPHD